MIDPRWTYVVALARCGSFTAAASAVGVTQPAVTRAVADIERRLGFALFHRSPRGVLLTERGRDVVERAARLIDDARQLMSGSALPDDPYADVVQIGVSPASLEWRLIETLLVLRARHPQTRFDISSASFERMVQQLGSGAVDVAVGFDAAFSEWPEFHREPIAGLESTLFVRKGHPALAHTPATAADLAAYEFVSPSDSRPYGALIRNIYESQGVEWRTRLHVIDYFPTVRRIVAASDAIGVVSRGHAATTTFRRRFETLEQAEPFPVAPMCCATRKQWAPKPAVRAFIKAMRDVLPAA